MGKRVAPLSTEGLSSDYLIGWLAVSIKYGRRITVKEWNRAVEAAREFKAGSRG